MLFNVCHDCFYSVWRSKELCFAAICFLAFCFLLEVIFVGRNDGLMVSATIAHYCTKLPGGCGYMTYFLVFRFTSTLLEGLYDSLLYYYIYVN
jgi:hypothetical protein